MDCNAILNAARHHQGLITWMRDGEYEWRHCGTGDEFDLTLVTAVVESHFAMNEIYFVGNRKDCGSLSRESASSIVRDYLKSGRASLWSPAFDRVIEFNPIGVFRLGSHLA